MDDHEFDGRGPSAEGTQAYQDYSNGQSNPTYGAGLNGLRVNGNGAQRRNGAALLGKPRKKRPAPSKTASHTEAIVGSSPQAAALREKIALYAEDDSPVLISGETGVGKELAARALHAKSARSKNHFMPVNLGAIPETLAAAEFFGHVKGAFTGAIAEREGVIAAADGGTLFLDEIGDMPAHLQAHLLRVLEDGLVAKLGANAARRVDFRLVAATNVCLNKSVREGKFRRDLFYRINVLPLDIPPLRERGDDVVEIAERFIEAHPNEKYRACRLTPNAADRLKRHRFPGNMRELRNVIYRALLNAKQNRIAPDDLQFDVLSAAAAGEDALSFDIAKAKDLVSRYIILGALKRADGNVALAAQMVQRSRATIHAVKKQFGDDNLASAYETACADLKVLMNNC